MMCYMGLYGSKVDGPKAITYLNQTIVFEWCVVRCIFSYIHQKGMSSKEIGIVCSKCFLNSEVNTIERSK
jgi:hypothetical protein